MENTYPQHEQSGTNCTEYNLVQADASHFASCSCLVHHTSGTMALPVDEMRSVRRSGELRKRSKRLMKRGRKKRGKQRWVMADPSQKKNRTKK
ncbi:hypothetical protein HHX47_DHR8000256 [Lentinula edodes]|nr:hypothetical protein HHX47_DHR8000256 [Lentinula edodes]